MRKQGGVIREHSTPNIPLGLQKRGALGQVHESCDDKLKQRVVVGGQGPVVRAGEGGVEANDGAGGCTQEWGDDKIAGLVRTGHGDITEWPA